MNTTLIAAHSQARSTLALGVTFTVILVGAYFGFVVMCAFAPGLLAQPVLAGGTVTWAFAYGLFVIVLGVVLTGLYVFTANRADMQRAGV
ncbi:MULTISPECIES: DUF485 domain-containing protein [unclassified Methylobacterium]|uniref:DUF485 domain-containing protein n=1 Tax=unclassified Methylobacterium TaxID=2615210 RepID=UPI00226ACBF8|nr:MULTISPECIES: DUF485 domain-containing protein [unclassified Methylobacterium]